MFSCRLRCGRSSSEVPKLLQSGAVSGRSFDQACATTVPYVVATACGLSGFALIEYGTRGCTSLTYAELCYPAGLAPVRRPHFERRLRRALQRERCLRAAVGECVVPRRFAAEFSARGRAWRGPLLYAKCSPDYCGLGIAIAKSSSVTHAVAEQSYTRDQSVLSRVPHQCSCSCECAF